MASRPILAIDLDGVLHPNHPPWQGVYQLPDSPTSGAQDYVRFVQSQGWRVEVHTARANAPNADAAVKAWLHDWGFPELTVSHVKRNASVYLDDRAVRFTGHWPSVPELEVAAVPWNRVY